MGKTARRAKLTSDTTSRSSAGQANRVAVGARNGHLTVDLACATGGADERGGNPRSTVQGAATTHSFPKQSELDTPLTDAEQQVLRLFGELLSAREVARHLRSTVQSVRSQVALIEHKLSQTSLRPSWNKESRKLSFGGLVVHRFRRPAPVVEMILSAFAEECWCDRIDDPLPPLKGRREADRLRKEIYALNRRLALPLIRFSLDGTGRGICWGTSLPALRGLSRR
jgi:DNA-binding CsgD family transcriptional regulator